MNKVLLLSGFAACLPLMAFADARMEAELNGLDIDLMLSAPLIHDVDASAISRGASQILKLTNRGVQAAQCQVEPGVADAMRPAGKRALLEPGTSALVLVDSRPIGRSTSARLSCTPERSS
ncbi:hypothetical protein ID144_13035 [Pseudomonas sp. JM0905a]|uniref:hypothetical protein n=1 Tax=Pseudomonas sp. JM0905a TaxID=2772484 RepID=UPI001687E00A|nr:hypothetical protein [Pseudomonas sp. JM0905a]MBD2837966.1 hypothetical protein [Pseudomonas sp. JM0905a]